MLRVKNVSQGTPPTRRVRDIRGYQIPFYIRPWNEQIAEELRKPFIKGFEWVTNPGAGRKDKVPIIDQDGYFDAMVDYILASFEEIGDEDGAPWPNDLPHKRRVIGLAVETGAQPIWEWVLEEAKTLGFVIEKERADHEKNSPPP